MKQWKINVFKDCIVETDGEKTRIVCERPNYRGSEENFEKDGALIAAAPELLDACKMAVKKHGEFDYLMKAIAKTEGGEDDYH
ncbi:hypothetical protein FP828_03675 [bacterium]|nr:hypothetical protein [Candidatus Omnitrophota bacterium]MBA3065572.1 hypothetical protein [bacterium]